MKLMGWTVDQYAVAKAYYCRFNTEPTADLNGARRVRTWWVARRADCPGEIHLAGVGAEEDSPWANEMFRAAINQVYGCASTCSP